MHASRLRYYLDIYQKFIQNMCTSRQCFALFFGSIWGIISATLFIFLEDFNFSLFNIIIYILFLLGGLLEGNIMYFILIKLRQIGRNKK